MPKNGRHVRLWIGIAGVGILLAVGCSTVLGLGEYTIDRDAGGAGDGPTPGGEDAGCDVDLSVQCYPCTPDEPIEFLNTCVEGACVKFDSERLSRSCCRTARCRRFRRPHPFRTREANEDDEALPAAPFAASLAAAAIVLLAGKPAFAVPCDALTRLGADGVPTTEPVPPKVYIAGSSPLKTMFSTLAPALFNEPNLPVTMVYRVTPSCTAAEQILKGATMAPDDVTEAIYWIRTARRRRTARRPPRKRSARSRKGSSRRSARPTLRADLRPRAALQGIPQGFADFLGPIQVAAFAVNKGSKEQSISAEAAYMVFGHAKLAPWTDPAFLFRRNASSGTQLLIGAAIGVDAKRWAGVDSGSSDQVFASLTSLATQAEMDKSVGILLADFASRQELRTLAYQHYGQRCAYRPDVHAIDKRNVREGRYAVWGNLHIFTQVDGSGLAKDPPRARSSPSCSVSSRAPETSICSARRCESTPCRRAR